MLGGMQEKAMKQMMEQELRSYAGTLAAMEREQREGMRALAESHGVEPAELGLEEREDDEERVEELVDAIVAQQTGDVWSLYVDHLAPDALTNTDRAKELASLGGDGWKAQIETWAQKYRDRAKDDVADLTDRELADVHTRETFGLGIEEFEQEVVNRDPARVLQQIVAGPIETHTEAVWKLADRED